MLEPGPGIFFLPFHFSRQLKIEWREEALICSALDRRESLGPCTPILEADEARELGIFPGSEEELHLSSRSRVVTQLSGSLLDRVDTGGVIGTLEGRQGCLRTSCTNIISGQTGSPIITKLQAESFNRDLSLSLSLPSSPLAVPRPPLPPPRRPLPLGPRDDTLNFPANRLLYRIDSVSGTDYFPPRLDDFVPRRINVPHSS